MSTAPKLVNEILNNNEMIIFNVLKDTLYPDATEDEAYMILNYCKAKKYNPILKPVHLVEMSIKTNEIGGNGKNIYKKKRVIMPGIGSYRIDASRSGQYAGMSAPEFGPDVTETFQTKDWQNKVITKTVTFPKWCKITVKKLLPNGSIAEFPALELWKENYARKKNEECPNEMWEKRSYGQLAKCAEAQALRKAFPDIVGNEYTHEEMEGKLIIEDDIKNKTTLNNSNVKLIQNKIIESEIKEIKENDIDVNFIISEIQNCSSLDDLQKIYLKHYKEIAFKKDQNALKLLVKEKDKRKDELILTEDFNEEINSETGEILP